MTKVEISKVVIENFKGIKNETFEFGKKTEIRGGNAQKKSSIYESYLWCLFGKNARGEQVNIQPRNEQGEIIHKLNTYVELHLIVNDNELVVKRELKEDWVKPRGTNKEQLKGTTTIYSINNVPLLKKEFDQKLNDICNLDTWAMCSDINSFFRLKVDERRKVIIGLAGNVSDIELSKDYPLVKKALEQGKNIDEYKRELQASKKKSKQELDEIPSRIDAQDKLIVDIDFAELEEEKQAKEKAIEVIDNILQSNVDTELIDERKDLFAKQRTIIDKINLRANEIKSEIDRKKVNIESNISLLKNLIESNTVQLNNFIKELENVDKDIQKAIQEITDKSNQWKKENEKEYTGSLICSECGQTYPQDRLENLLENFNQAKLNRLRTIEDEGTIIKEKENNLIAQKNKITLLVEEKRNFIADQQEQFKKANEQLNEVPELGYALKEDEEYNTLLAAEKSIVEQLEGVSTEDNSTNDEYKTRKQELKQELEEVIKKLSQRDTNSRIAKLKDELNSRSKELAQTISDLEKIEFEIIEFSKYRISKIEESVSSYFQMVTWKMYEQNKTNDGEKPICEALVNGVPYSETNEGMTMAIGTDVINGLSKAFDLSLPLFIDRFESLEILPKINSQLITLEVAKGEKLQVNIIK
ncbi:MAG: hypothetical protein PHO12_04895 [Bacteroidales bacterium]|nr:hypothetical protein [Bacteroidales bacterium]MDD4685149.1 hypothetical protein [Bacteroidales bacterium]